MLKGRGEIKGRNGFLSLKATCTTNSSHPHKVEAILLLNELSLCESALMASVKHHVLSGAEQRI